VECSGFLDGGMNGSGGTYRRPLFNSHNVACNSKQSLVLMVNMRCPQVPSLKKLRAFT
ncbi:hypothetical protein AG4045_000104, partial [Apium graveolens]